MAAKYYYSRGDHRFGPFSPEQMKSLFASAEIQPTDLVWKEGMADRVPAARFKGLVPPPRTASPPLPTRPLAQNASSAPLDSLDSPQAIRPAPLPPNADQSPVAADTKANTKCPHCHGAITYKASEAGKPAKCALCKRMLLLPSTADEPCGIATNSVQCPHCMGILVFKPSEAGKALT